MMTDKERAERLSDLALTCRRLRELVQRVREGNSPQTEEVLANITRHSKEVARQSFGYVLGDSPELGTLSDGEITPGVVALGVSLMTRAFFNKGESPERTRDLIDGSVYMAFREAVLELVAEDALQVAQEALGDADVAKAVREAQGLGKCPSEAPSASGGHSGGKPPMAGGES